MFSYLVVSTSFSCRASSIFKVGILRQWEITLGSSKFSLAQAQFCRSHFLLASPISSLLTDLSADFKLQTEKYTDCLICSPLKSWKAESLCEIPCHLTILTFCSSLLSLLGFLILLNTDRNTGIYTEKSKKKQRWMSNFSWKGKNSQGKGMGRFH